MAYTKYTFGGTFTYRHNQDRYGDVNDWRTTVLTFHIRKTLPQLSAPPCSRDMHYSSVAHALAHGGRMCCVNWCSVHGMAFEGTGLSNDRYDTWNQIAKLSKYLGLSQLTWIQHCIHAQFTSTDVYSLRPYAYLDTEFKAKTVFSNIGTSYILQLHKIYFNCASNGIKRNRNEVDCIYPIQIFVPGHTAYITAIYIRFDSIRSAYIQAHLPSNPHEVHLDRQRTMCMQKLGK